MELKRWVSLMIRILVAVGLGLAFGIWYLSIGTVFRGGDLDALRWTSSWGWELLAIFYGLVLFATVQAGRLDPTCRRAGWEFFLHATDDNDDVQITPEYSIAAKRA